MLCQKLVLSKFQDLFWCLEKIMHNFQLEIVDFNPKGGIILSQRVAETYSAAIYNFSKIVLEWLLI